MSSEVVAVVTVAPPRRRLRQATVRTIVRRSGHLLAVLIGVTFLVSFMLDVLPGDPAESIAGQQASPEQIERIRHELNLDRSVPVRYALWVANIVRGDLGISYRTSQPIGDAILQRLPVSLELMILGQLVAICVAVLIGVYAGWRPRSWIGRLTTPGTVLAISTPEFVFALGLIYVGAILLGWFPATGFTPLSEGLGANLLTVALPAAAISLEPIGAYIRLLRSDLVRTLGQDFMLAAKAKGMTVPNLLFRQALRPSSLSFVTLAGLNTARLLGSVVVVESLFGIPGIGRLLVESINYADIMTVQAVVVVIAVAYVVVNVLTDLAYALIDPRVRDAR